jgi:2-polyprenyl-3-methyl-5-hydroxy-6-metoxy-1,4-benzoquinol methylase
MFKHRSEKNEMLDAETLNLSELSKNLKEFSMINQWLGTKRTLIQALEKIHSKYPEQKFRIADLGCGGGDLLLSIQVWASNKNISMELVGIDVHPSVVEYAQNKMLNSNIQIKLMDVFSDAFKQESFDIVCLNNVCHHFSDAKIIDLIHDLKSRTRLAIVINDLERHPLAYYAIKWLTKCFRLSTMAQYDGPLSVLKAFKIQDLKKYVAKLPIHAVELKKTWAFRWQIIIWC